jgi:hypothetical protein
MRFAGGTTLDTALLSSREVFAVKISSETAVVGIADVV